MEKLNKLIGHYTDHEGLLGILNCFEIWATNILYLNDSKEFFHAIELIKGLIPQSKIIKSDSNFEKYKLFEKELIIRLAVLKGVTPEYIYTISLSEEANLLSQWRGYCGDNGGYCLVFDAEEFSESIVDDCVNAFLKKCVYEPEEKERQLRELLNKYWEKYRVSNHEKTLARIWSELEFEISIMASYFKHPSFSEEREVRIIIYNDHGLDKKMGFRTGQNSLIPFIKVPIEKYSLKKVYVGPSANMKLAKKSLTFFLEDKYGYEAVHIDNDLEILESDIPFRKT